jgi:anti-sigma regulatory factor (Ser/Thr protein kinase)
MAVILIRVVTVCILGAIAVAAYRQRRRGGSIATWWLFLAFSLLALVSAALALLPDEIDSGGVELGRRLVLAVLPLFPYFLFRFTAVLTPPPRWFDWVATGLTTTVVCSTLLIGGARLTDAPRPAWYVIALLSQWTVLSIFTAVQLWRVGRSEPTIARRRIRTLSVATIGLTIALLLSGAVAGSGIIGLMVRIIPLASAVLFLLALAPPPQMRAIWRRPEEERLRPAVEKLMAATSTHEVTEVLLPQVASLLGGRGAALIHPDGTEVASHGVAEATGGTTQGRVDVVDLSVGRLAVFTSPYTPLFGRDEFELLRSLAALAELALERCKEHRIAETLQRSLLPQELPAVPGVRLDARYVPGGAGAVGGDWYDVIPLPDGRVGLVIGDVMGHGIGAAALMGHLRSALRAYAIDGDPPATVLNRLDALMEHSGISELATVLYLILDTDTSTVRFASAGHLLPVLHRTGHPPIFVNGGLGPPLGIWREAPAAASTTLPCDATLVLFTDGLIERRGESITQGIDRMAAAMHDASGTSKLSDHLIMRLLPAGFGDDDAAMLLLEVVGAADIRASGPMQADITLSANPTSVSEARVFVVGTLEQWALREEIEVAELLTSEIVTNAVVHARTPIRLVLDLAAGLLRVGVSDGADASPSLRRSGPTEESGRGLMLVDALATRWGIDRDDGGKQVWFEVLVSPQEASPSVVAAAVQSSY